MTRAEKVVAILGAVAVVVAAVVGAFIGGNIANNGAEAILKQQEQAQRDQDARAARASARLLIKELRGLQRSVSVAAEDAFWWRGDYAIDVSSQDLKQLASGLRNNLWDHLANVFDVEDELEQEQIAGFGWVGGQPSSDMNVAARMLRALQQVIPELSDFAHLTRRPLRRTGSKFLVYQRGDIVPPGDTRLGSCNDQASR